MDKHRHKPICKEFTQDLFVPKTPRRCTHCNQKAKQCCSRCPNVYYCSKQCQRAHWTTHAHNCEWGSRRRQEMKKAQLHTGR
jgi:hypothetical protein